MAEILNFRFINSIGMANRFFRTTNFSPSQFYGREISGKLA
jgi:hypothetical protein